MKTFKTIRRAVATIALAGALVGGLGASAAADTASDTSRGGTSTGYHRF